MSLHMDQCEGLFQEENEQTRWHFVRVKLVLVHVSFLCESKGSVLETYTSMLFLSYNWILSSERLNQAKFCSKNKDSFRPLFLLK